MGFTMGKPPVSPWSHRNMAEDAGRQDLFFSGFGRETHGAHVVHIGWIRRMVQTKATGAWMVEASSEAPQVIDTLLILAILACLAKLAH